jgi:hypothetical protein
LNETDWNCSVRSPRSNGSFAVHHRYRKAKRYGLKLSVTDGAGQNLTKAFPARVRRR